MYVIVLDDKQTLSLFDRAKNVISLFIQLFFQHRACFENCIILRLPRTFHWYFFLSIKHCISQTFYVNEYACIAQQAGILIE